MMKSIFYFTLKAHLVLQIFIFLSWPFWSYRKTTWSERKLRLISKFMMSLTGKQIITRHVLLNISKSKDNQITWEIFFLKTRGQNLVQKLVPDLNQNSAYLFINSLKCYTVCFYCMAKLRSTKRYWH